jgi:hypothetical protein
MLVVGGYRNTWHLAYTKLTEHEPNRWNPGVVFNTSNKTSPIAMHSL